MRQYQEIKQVMGQRLVVTPQLRQAIEILQLGSLELAAYVQEQIMQNPLLEIADNGEDVAADAEVDTGELEREQIEEWLDYFADSSDLGLAQAPPVTDRPALVETIGTAGPTLADHLRLQVALADVGPDLRPAVEEVITALDDDGYLRVDLADLASQSSAATDPGLLERGLSLVQGLDPIGVGARDLRECLLLQLKAMAPQPALACTLVSSHLDDIAAARIGRLVQATGASREQVAAALELVRTLDPRPGAAFAAGWAPRYIVPDALIELVGSEYVVALNDSATPQLRINPYYRRLTSSSTGPEGQAASAFLGQRLQAALWLMRCVEQRRSTLYRVVDSICRSQLEFLAHGVHFLKPMTLKDIATEIGVHESTVSRAVANKYVQTPQGSFELRFFFTSSLGSASGVGQVSSTSVKNVLGQLIQAEDPQRPHSDQTLAELLQQRGASLSRRTVTKYRRELGIPSSAQRRRP